MKEKRKKSNPLFFPVPDWVTIVNELIRFGYPKLQIARAANCSREVIYGILNGSMPSWYVGEAILKLHKGTKQ